MMDETEIKLEFPYYRDQCCVCLSVSRKLLFVREYLTLFKNITYGFKYHIPMEELLVCWECYALLRKVDRFRQQVYKANELFISGQNYIYGTQSSLTTIILNDFHPNTVYINNANIPTDIQTDVKTIDDDDDDDYTHGQGDDVEPALENDDDVKIEELPKEDTEIEHKKSKTNRWAIKRALQNKKPKFKILTEYTKDLFRQIPLNKDELLECMQNERNSKYYKSKRFKCKSCVLAFETEALFVKHNKKFHSNKIGFTCDICKARISNKNLLIQHIKAHYKKYVCTLCDFSCYDGKQKRWHYEKKHRKVLQCLKCELKYGSRKEFFKHYKEWHEKFVCDHCGISFKMRYCVKDHIRKQHSPFECKPCNKRWARYNGLWLHNKTTHARHDAAYCVECDKQYRDVYRYRWHLANSARHSKRRKHRIPCPGCDKIFSKNIYMKDHYNLVHLKFYKYRCEQCDKNFIRNADLVKHTRRVHQGILPPKNKICYMCGKGFSTNKILTNHLRTHTGEKPFACSVCNARFAQSTALTAHARAIHTHTDKTT